MDLVIDIGNTRCKVGIFNIIGEMLFFENFENLSLSRLQFLCDEYKVRRSILSSVRKEDPELITSLASNTQHVLFSHTSKLPITVAYHTPQTLGLDRLAGAVASCQSFPKEDVLSIQAGSCMVYDFVDRNGIYHGGAISPGIDMRFKALKQFTGKLPLIEKSEINYYVGNDTQQSIKSGVINGLIFEVKGFIDQYKSDYPNLKIILSGGDAEYLRKSIKNVIFAGSNFILKGLHEILKINAEEIL